MILDDLKVGDEFEFDAEGSFNKANKNTQIMGVKYRFLSKENDRLYKVITLDGVEQKFFLCAREVKLINVPETNAVVEPAFGETITNERGAKQSNVPYRCDLVPPRALLRVAEILAVGAKKYGEWNWTGLDLKDHLNHAEGHIKLYQAGDTSEDHLGNVACRALFALDTALREKEGKK